jgi:hypothetical protein
MASMGLQSIPLQDSPHDTSDEAYEAELSRRIHEKQDAVVDRFVELLADQLYRKDGNALATMHLLLSGPAAAPIQDLYDARAYSHVGRPDDAALATLVRYCYAQANLAVAEQVRGELSGVAF